MSPLEHLKKVMPPPVNPAHLPTGGGWHSVERRLQIELPDDYKEFIALYGTGAVDGFLWILNPFAPNQSLNLIDQAIVRLDAQRAFSEETGIRTPYPLHPEKGGLLPWSISDNGDVLYWLCAGPASSWVTVVSDGRASAWQEFELSAGQFLAALLKGDLSVKAFPEDFPSGSPEYIRAP